MPRLFLGIRWRLVTMILVLIVAMGALLIWESNRERERAVDQVQGEILAQAPSLLPPTTSSSILSMTS